MPILPTFGQVRWAGFIHDFLSGAEALGILVLLVLLVVAWARSAGESKGPV
jgi:hypothetical protein